MIFGEGETLDPRLEKPFKALLQTGEFYAADLRTLLPNLIVTSTDEAAAFDVGEGADLAAFLKLGFQQAVWTNDPDPLYKAIARSAFNEEQALLAALLKIVPREYYGSSLSVGEWLKDLDFRPKLTTMLHMAPMYFTNGSDPAMMLRLFGDFARRLPSASSIVLSAYNDHRNSERAFMLAHDHFLAEGLQSQLYIDGDTDNFRSLGSRILVLHGAPH